jgi:hypothetical protein
VQRSPPQFGRTVFSTVSPGPTATAAPTGPTTPIVQPSQQPTRITIAPTPNVQSASTPNVIPLPTRIILSPVATRQNQVEVPTSNPSVVGPTTPMVQATQLPTRISIIPSSSSGPGSYSASGGQPIPGSSSYSTSGYIIGPSALTSSGYNSGPGYTTSGYMNGPSGLAGGSYNSGPGYTTSGYVNGPSGRTAGSYGAGPGFTTSGYINGPSGLMGSSYSSGVASTASGYMNGASKVTGTSYSSGAGYTTGGYTVSGSAHNTSFGSAAGQGDFAPQVGNEIWNGANSISRSLNQVEQSKPGQVLVNSLEQAGGALDRGAGLQVLGWGADAASIYTVYNRSGGLAATAQAFGVVGVEAAGAAGGPLAAGSAQAVLDIGNLYVAPRIGSAMYNADPSLFTPK